MEIVNLITKIDRDISVISRMIVYCLTNIPKMHKNDNLFRRAYYKCLIMKKFNKLIWNVTYVFYIKYFLFITQ